MNIKRTGFIHIAALLLTCPGRASAQTVVFETTSPYHHIQVVDNQGNRTLHFDNSTQSRMSLSDPLQGHFEYTEYFHMPWLWNDHIQSVLMIGLGGGSIQRAFQAYWPQVKTETVEIDPQVLDVARRYFHFQETENMKVVIGDGRMFLRRTQETYDLIIMDAYTANRYGSYIPYPLVTQEFFIMARNRLTDNGMLAYNVIGKVNDTQNGILGSIYNTLKTCFTHVYMFSALRSKNVVLLATASQEPVTLSQLMRKVYQLTESKGVPFPNFNTCIRQFRADPPASAAVSEILTDDFAPVDGLIKIE